MTDWKDDSKVKAAREKFGEAARREENWYLADVQDELDNLLSAVAACASVPSPVMVMCGRCLKVLGAHPLADGEGVHTCAKRNPGYVEGPSPESPQPFPDGSYEIPLERRLEAAATSFGGHPRLGLSPTDKHTIPLTTDEGAMLLTLYRALLNAGKPSSDAPEITNAMRRAHNFANAGASCTIHNCIVCASPPPAPAAPQETPRFSARLLAKELRERVNKAHAQSGGRPVSLIRWEGEVAAALHDLNFYDRPASARRSEGQAT